LLDVWLNTTVLRQKKKNSDEDAESLQKEILLVERAKIMIPCNVWTSNYFSNSFTLISWAW
jgi:hypothetical protein